MDNMAAKAADVESESQAGDSGQQAEVLKLKYERDLLEHQLHVNASERDALRKEIATLRSQLSLSAQESSPRNTIEAWSSSPALGFKAAVQTNQGPSAFGHLISQSVAIHDMTHSPWQSPAVPTMPNMSVATSPRIGSQLSATWSSGHESDAGIGVMSGVHGMSGSWISDSGVEPNLDCSRPPLGPRYHHRSQTTVSYRYGVHSAGGAPEPSGELGISSLLSSTANSRRVSQHDGTSSSLKDLDGTLKLLEAINQTKALQDGTTTPPEPLTTVPSEEQLVLPDIRTSPVFVPMIPGVIAEEGRPPLLSPRPPLRHVSNMSAVTEILAGLDEQAGGRVSQLEGELEDTKRAMEGILAEKTLSESRMREMGAELRECKERLANARCTLSAVVGETLTTELLDKALGKENKGINEEDASVNDIGQQSYARRLDQQALENSALDSEQSIFEFKTMDGNIPVEEVEELQECRGLLADILESH